MYSQTFTKSTTNILIGEEILSLGRTNPQAFISVIDFKNIKNISQNKNNTAEPQSICSNERGNIVPEQNSQQGSVGMNKKKDGFMKTPRWVEYELFGPNSPLPEKWRVFNFIKYRIQDNKRTSETEVMSREYIIEQTGITPNNFSRIIKSLQKDKLIEFEKGNYRDSATTYRLHREFFQGSVIAADVKGKKRTAHTWKPAVDKSQSDVDNSESQEQPNINSKLNEDTQHQNDVSTHQNDAEPVVTPIELLTESALRSPSLKPFINPRAPEKNGESFTRLGGTGNRKLPPRDKAKQIRWIIETNGGETVSYEEWERTAI